MVDESDGIEEAVEGQMRLLVTAAARAGDRLARMREDALRRAQATSEREARELHSRLAAEQRAVRADLAGVQRADWWEKATPQRIAQAYESAVAWRDEEPEAARAEQRIIDELRTRHGINPDELRSQVAAADAQRAQQQSQAEKRDRAEASALMAEATAEEDRAQSSREDRPDVAAEHEQRADSAHEEASTKYDSAERRASTAADLETQGHDHETVARQMRADVSQGAPATEATNGSRTPRARKGRGRSATSRPRERGGLAR